MELSDLHNLSDINVDKIYLTALDILFRMEMVTPGHVMTLKPKFDHGVGDIEKGAVYPEHRKEAVDVLSRLGAFNRPPWDTAYAELRYTFEMYPDEERLREIVAELEKVRASRRMPAPIGPRARPKQVTASWSDVEIELLSDTELRAKIGDSPARRYTMVDLELNDRRKGDVPSDLWTALKVFAKYNGQITSEMLHESGMPKKVERLGEKLRAFFKLEESPFHRYTRKDGYRTRFRISDGRREAPSLPSVKHVFRSIPNHLQRGPSAFE